MTFGLMISICSIKYGRHVRSAFKNVGDVNLFPRESHCLDNFGEQLARATDERFALGVFIRARRFADEHDLSIGIADTKNGLRARAREVWTFDASRDACLHRRELFGFLRILRDFHVDLCLANVVGGGQRGDSVQCVERTSRCTRAMRTFVAHALERLQNRFERLRKLHQPHIVEFCANRQMI